MVKLVAEKSSKELYAMKVIRKEEVIKKKQEGHIRAERDIMAAASHLNPIVKLYHSFQDKVSSLSVALSFTRGVNIFFFFFFFFVFLQRKICTLSWNTWQAETC